MAKLNFMDRDNVLREFEIKEDVTTIGREANNKLVIADSSVSRLHALLEKKEDGYYLVDKNSSNGSFVNGKKVSEQKLSHSDKVSLGNASLVFEDESQIQATFILQRPEPSELTVEDRPTEAVPKPNLAPPPPSVSAAPPIRPTPPPAPPPTPAPAAIKTPPPAPPPPVAPPPPKMEAAGPTLCPSCKKPVEGKAKFCGFCGAPIAADKPAVVAAPKPASPPAPPIPKMSPPPAAVPVPPKPTQSAPPVAMARSGALEYAGFGPRLVAYLIDGLILGALTLIPYGICMYTFIMPMQRNQQPGPMAWVIFAICMLVILAITLGYQIYFVGLKGATPGKKIMKLKVTLPDGQYPVGIGKAVVRLIGYMISGAICYIGFLMIIFDKEEHRALHDRIAGTRVIKEA